MNKPMSHYGLIPPLLRKTAADSTRWNLEEAFAKKKPLTISFLNAHGLTTAIRNMDFYAFLYKSDYLLRDGIGVKIALRLFKIEQNENLNGTDLIPKIIEQHKTAKIAIFGTKDEVLNICKKKLKGAGCTQTITTAHGFHPQEFYLETLQKAKSSLVILCMGMPKQELVAAYLRKEGYNGTIICGGGWADFYSDTMERAPEWVRNISMEWLFRLYKEPKRLWRRYTLDVVFFFFSILRAKYLLIKKQKMMA